MSAFVNPTLTEPNEVPCPCPPHANGNPRHEQDTILIRSRLHYGDLQAISRAGSIFGVWDNEAATFKMVELGIVSWTFTDDDGNPVEPSREMIERLDPAIAVQIQRRLETVHAGAQDRMKLPNGSGGRSAQSSPATTASQANRASRRSKKPSTPKSS